VKFGFRLPNIRGYDSFDYLLNLALEAENLGYDSLWVSDHLLYPETFSTPSSFFFDSLTTLASLGPSTKKILLGTAVLLPLRNPILAANMIVTLDHATKGRLILGFGVGWYKQEFEILGIPFKERGKILDEYIELLLKLWKSSKVTFKGSFFQFDISFSPKPYQKPHPKILIGGRAKYAKKRIKKFGDGWIPTSLTVEEFKEGRERIGNNKLIYALDLLTCVYEKDPPRKEMNFLNSWLGEDFMERALVGKPKEVRERIEEYKKAGVNHFIFSFPPFYREKEMLRLLAKELFS